MDPVLLTGIIGLIVCLCVRDTERNRRGICIIMCILFILQAGLRDYLHASNDTYNYLRSYRALLPFSLSEVIESLNFKMDSYEDRDPGYSIFVKITQCIIPDFRFFLLIVATIISIPLSRIIYKYTDSIQSVVVAALLYESLFAGFFETGIRQTIAMGIVYFSLPFIEKRQALPHYLMLALAYTIHSSSLIFAPFYYLLKIKKPQNYLLWSILLMPVIMGTAPFIIKYLGEGSMFEGYAFTTVDNTGTPIFSALLLLVGSGVWLFRKKFDTDNIRDRILIAGIICALVLMPSTWVNSNFIRLVFFYLVFIMPIVPDIVRRFNQPQNIKSLVNFCIGISLVALHLMQ